MRVNAPLGTCPAGAESARLDPASLAESHRSTGTSPDGGGAVHVDMASAVDALAKSHRSTEAGSVEAELGGWIAYSS